MFFVLLQYGNIDSPCASQPHRSLMFSYNIILGHSRLNNSFWSSTKKARRIDFIVKYESKIKTKQGKQNQQAQLTSKVNCYERHLKFAQRQILDFECYKCLYLSTELYKFLVLCFKINNIKTTSTFQK